MKVLSRSTLVAVCALALARPVCADTNAVTVTGGYSDAGAALGVGFSFVPTTNLLVTGVQLYDAALQDAMVSIWTSTNAPIAIFEIGPTSNTYGVFSTNLSFLLGAGVDYTIMVHDGWPNITRDVSVGLYESNFMVSPLLTNYRADILGASNTLSEGNGTLYLFGLNFSFVTTNLLIPQLSVQLPDANDAVVSWPGPSPGFILQTNASIAVENWIDFAGVTNFDGLTNSVTVSPATNDLFFRLRPVLN